VTDESSVETHRAETAAQLESGNRQAADQAYALELQARDGELQESEESHEGESAEGAEQIFEQLAQEFDSDAVAQLQADWGSQAGENLELGRALVEDHPELSTIAEQFGLQDHPGILALAAEIAKKSGYSFTPTGAQRSQQESPSMSESGMSREAYQNGLARFNERIEKAFDSRTRDAIYAEQMEWIARVKPAPDSGIVDGITRTY
jgi:hypothetical protein